MSGIIGYIGNKRVVPVLLEGLERLQYRGYDSAGLAVIKDGTLGIRRASGKLRNLEEVIRLNPLDGTYGIGHTRWATHGAPTTTNAHPHVDCTGRLAVVHNGIIENADELRAKLTADGVEFRSQTDTEDVLIVQINPLVRRKIPRSTREIMARVNEITFNSSLMGELRTIQLVNRMIAQGQPPHRAGRKPYRHIRVHRIVLEGLGERFSSASRLGNDFRSFELLRKLGERAARRFLDAHYADIGERGTVDLEGEMFAE